MEFKDYYNILGVKPEANGNDIKTAYRRLARKYHPDRNKEAGAEERFKEINEAYEVLKDDQKRQAYDGVRAGGYRAGDQFRPPPGWSPSGGTGGFNFNSEAFGGGGADFSDFFASLFGQAARQHGGGRPRRQRGADVNARIEIDLTTAYTGGKTRVALRDGSGERVLEVKIPAGVMSGQVIRLAGQGQPGGGGGAAGDLLLEVTLRPDSRFELEGRNVLATVRVAPWEAALGANIDVDTLAGPVQVRVPAGSQSGRRLRLKGRGLPGKMPGDELVKLEIATPPADSDDAKAAYDAFKAAFAEYRVRG